MSRTSLKAGLPALLALVLCALFVTADGLDAQRGDRRGGRRMDPAQMQERVLEGAQEMYDVVKEKLALTGEQAEKADELFEKSQQERKKLFDKIEDGELGGRDAFGRLRDVQEDFMDEFRNLLDGDQKDKLEELQKQFREQREQRRRR